MVNRAILGTPNVGPTNQMGVMADPSKTCDSRAREYHTGNATTTETNDGTFANWTKVRDANWRRNRWNGERPSDTKQPIEVAMGLNMSKDNRSGSTIRGTTMASLRSKIYVSFVPQHRYRGKTPTNTKIPSWQYLWPDYPQTLGDDGDSFYTPKKYHIRSECVLLTKSEKGWNGRTILQHFERIGGKLRFWKSWGGDHQGHFHHKHVWWWYSTQTSPRHSWPQKSN